MLARVFGVVLLAACQSASATDPPAKSAKPDPAALHFHMTRSFDVLRATERVLIRGGLDDARALARSLADAPEPSSLEPWAKYNEAVRAKAAFTAAAPSIDEACRRITHIAKACADCHQATGASPEFASRPPLVPDRDTITARMARHRWAVDRLWEGNVGGSDEAWRAGLEVLAQTPIPFASPTDDREPLARQLQQQATTSLRSSSTKLDDRATAYGEILVTCAACHSGTSKTPR
jgi:cytochrome c553